MYILNSSIRFDDAFDVTAGSAKCGELSAQRKEVSNDGCPKAEWCLPALARRMEVRGCALRGNRFVETHSECDPRVSARVLPKLLFFPLVIQCL